MGRTNGQADVHGVSGFGWGAYLLPRTGTKQSLRIARFLPVHPLFAERDRTADLPVGVFAIRPTPDRTSGPFTTKTPAPSLRNCPPATTSAISARANSRTVKDCCRGQPCRGDGMFQLNEGISIKDVTDGTTTTLHVGERRTRTDKSPQWFSTWVGVVPEGEEAFARILGVADHTPNHVVSHLDDFSSPHSGGVFFLFADGHVRWVSENINLLVYQRLATRKGGGSRGRFLIACLVTCPFSEPCAGSQPLRLPIQWPTP